MLNLKIKFKRQKIFNYALILEAQYLTNNYFTEYFTANIINFKKNKNYATLYRLLRDILKWSLDFIYK